MKKKMMKKMNTAAILSTVNAPYSEQLNEEALAYCLKFAQEAQNHPGHVSSFFGEVDPIEQVAFAAHFGLSKSDLIYSAKEFASYSGEHYSLIA